VPAAPALPCCGLPRAEELPAVRAGGAPALPRTQGQLQGQIRARGSLDGASAYGIYQRYVSQENSGKLRKNQKTQEKPEKPK